jgi:HPt (histidine-containing phosphotransfer) domain-containing protein
MNALHEITGGDAAFERELIDTFVSSGDQCLAEILAALRTRDFATIGKRAHSLKGASANIHAAGLADSRLEPRERRARTNLGRDRRVSRCADRQAQVGERRIAHVGTVILTGWYSASLAG